MMWPVRSVIILLLGLYACSGQEVDEYEGNGQPAIVSKTRKNQHVSILKQIHRHNEDGSYTYGFEGSDGSFKIETKTRAGEVTGKYGYVDDVGKLRVVEYGANAHGFQPSGEGITVPPPTLVELPRDDESDVEQARRPAKMPSYAVDSPAPSSGQRRPPSGGRFDGRPAEFRPKSPVPDVGRMSTPLSVGTYQTYEDQPDRQTESPRAQRRDGPAGAAAPRPAPRSFRTGSVLEQLVEQYALPESGSPVAHSVSFGTDI